MNIQPLCSGFMFKVCDLERRQRMQRMGFPTAPGFRPVKEDISGIIEMQLLVPLVAELRRITGKSISYSRWGTDGYFRLLTGGRPFVLIYLPNPSTGRVFFRRLSPNGRPCSMSKPLYNTDQLRESLPGTTAK